MLTVPKGAWATCGVIGLDPSGIKFFLKAMPLLHENPTHTQTDLFSPAPGSSMRSLPCPHGSSPIVLVVPSSSHLLAVIIHSLSTQSSMLSFVFQLPLQPFSVPISILPSSLFLLCEQWLKNLANLGSNNRLYKVLFYSLLIHMLYWTIFSCMGGLFSLPHFAADTSLFRD